jgi:HD-like signal output (HDOD) protein
MPSRDQILAAIRSSPKVPAPPQTIFKVLELTNDADSSIDDLARVISHDSGLTAQLLRRANSAYNACVSPTSSVVQACVRLGIKQIRSAVLNQHIVNGLGKARPPGFDPDRYWQSAFATSVAAQELCRQLLPARAGDASTAGLLCDVGIGLLAYGLPKDYLPVLKQWSSKGDSTDLERLERRILGVTHSDIGAAILSDWKLDAELIEAVRQHHLDPECPDARDVDPFIRIVAVAVVLSEIALRGPDMELVGRLFSHLEKLASNPDEVVSRLMDQLVANIQASARQLAIELGPVEAMRANFDGFADTLHDSAPNMTFRPMPRGPSGG